MTLDTLDQLLTEMPQALSTYGTPAHRLEEAMGICADKLGVPAEFFSMPTAVLCTIGRGQDMRTHIVRVAPGDVNLEKLDGVDRVLGQVIRHQIVPDQALAAIRAIRAAPARYPAALTVVCCAVVAACAAVFFGGGWPDVGAAASIGLLVGILGTFAARRRQMARVTDFASGLAAALLAGALVRLLPDAERNLAPGVVTIASLIVLVPGLTLTVAVNELATRNLVAGTSRLMGAVMILLSIGFGVGLGQALSAAWWGAPRSLVAAPASVPLPVWSQWVAILLVPCALTVLFRARPRDVLVIVPAAVIGYHGARLGAGWLGPELGAWVGALAVGVFGNGHARLSRRPTAITLVPGIMLLVPGALGFRSISSFLTYDVLSGVQTAFTVAIVATAIVTGLLLANVLVPSRQSL